MALSLPTGKTQLPAQAPAATCTPAEKSDCDTHTLFADALRRTAGKMEGAPAEGDVLQATDQPVVDTPDASREADAVDATDTAVVSPNATSAQDATLPGMAQPVLPLALNIAMPNMQPPASAVQARTGVEGKDAKDAKDATRAVDALQFSIVDLIQKRRTSAAARDAMFVPAASQSVEAQGDSGVRAQRNVLQTATVAQPGAEESFADLALAGRAATATSGSAQASLPLVFPANASTDALPVATLKLPAGAPQQWRQPLAEALGERLQVQLAARSENAVIRLDPPMMGSIEIRIHHEAGALQVQISASHGEVLRQLNHVGESLRQDLAQHQYTDVSVRVSDSLPDGRQRQRQQEGERDPGRALEDSGQQSTAFALLSDND